MAQNPTIKLDWKRGAAAEFVLVTNDTVTIPAERLGADIWRSARKEAAPDRIVWQGRKLIDYRPLAGAPFHLVEQFTNADTAAKALKFVQKFGFLNQADEEQARAGETVDWFLGAARELRTVREFVKERKNLSKLDGALLSVRLGLEVIAAKRGGLSVEYSVKTLHEGLAAAFGLMIVGGATLRKCPQCNMIFACGPGTGRKGSAEYCSEKHRFAFHTKARRARDRKEKPE